MRTERARFVLGSLVWVALFVVVRAVALDADPPVRLPNGARGQELWAEGAAKAQEARNWALFGRWQTNPADNYQFWRAQSPVWVYSLAGFLKAFGVSTVVHRAHSIFVAALGFWLLLLHARPRLSGVAWTALGAFLAFNYYYVHYTRVGLIEPMVNLFAVALIYCAARALTQPLWLIGAMWALALALLSKMSGLYLAPVFALALVLTAARHRSRRDWFWIGLSALVVVSVLAWIVTSEAYRQRAVWNVAHMAYNKDGQTEVDFERVQIGTMLGRLFDRERWLVAFFPLFPVAALLAPLALAYSAYQVWKTRTWPEDTLLIVWLASAYGSLLFTASTYARFHLVLFPPMALLGARGLDIAWRALQRFHRARWSLPVVVAAAVAYVHGVPYRDWYEQRTYSVRNTNRKIARLVGDKPAVFIGMWAPWLMFDTRYEFYTVRSYFNVSKTALKQLGITHLLLRPGDLSGSHYRRKLPRPYASRQALKRFRVKGEHVTLYEIRRPAR